METEQFLFSKLVANIFGYLGCHFHSIKLNSWRSLLNLLLNILLNCLSVYGMFVYDPHNWRIESNPFFTRVMLMSYKRIYPILYAIISIHYYQFGHQMIHLLDMLLPYTRINQRQQLLPLIFIFIISHFVYLSLNYTNLEDLYQQPTFEKFCAQLGCYTLSFQITLIYNMVIFYQCLIESFLHSIEMKLLYINQTNSIDDCPRLIYLKILKKIEHVACLCKKMNHLFSYGLLIQITLIGISFIIKICALVLFRQQWRATINEAPHICLCYLYLSKISIYNLRIAKRLRMIRRLMLKSYWKYCSENHYNSTIGHRINDKRKSDQIVVEKFDPIRFFELTNIYKNDFIVRIFRIWNMDFNFILSITVFIINYIVFIVSTN
uniref:Uncharacterized protein LOC113789275 n=1 Tax=Dermatophagoides pteronyssinus TaxID=6956 RepID=A0A6P6XRS3_DERPT|nr:uncharacterized protein LOC113789275 [Dermatophagoides pteronyssinus]